MKGHCELIEAFAQTFAGQPYVSLRIAGDGRLHDELQTQITSRGLESQVSLLGRLSRTEVHREIRSSHCLLLTSHYETFGVVLIEALALGRPVIASMCGGPECIVDDSNGLLVPPSDVAALAHAMKIMKQNIRNYDCSAIRRDVLKRFGRQRLLTDLNAAYQQCLGQNQP